ncbi:MAG: 4-hydroxyphenylacetate 3-hydroxylase family protein, partial [Candidatus Thorarchaeota archaeon]|jgi:4-hydroxyphenylacetate 3-monooxygenase/4-hydroxybutyryl-CoA dehydratase/vinylacetyl-CoA-Delta-isomerase
MKTGDEYLKALYKMKPNVIINGENVTRDDPRLQSVAKTMSLTLDKVNEPEFKDLLTAQSEKYGTVNRFTHIHQSVDDLLKKQEVTRKLCRLSGGCIFRCMGIDAMNALSIITHRAESMTGRPYNQRFMKYLKYWQENDIIGSCAQTDPKGNRALRPHQQADPDLYLRVIEHRDDGIVVRGAKNHITAAAVAEEIIVTPTRFLTPEEDQYAVAFAVPGDWDGVKLVTRASSFKREQFSCPMGDVGDVENFVIFDDVFIPNDRVFLSGLEGEHALGGWAALLFALYHRHSYTGCKPASSEIILGFSALVSEYNGIEDKKHVQSKLAELISVSELVYAAGVAAAYKATKDDSGTMIPDAVYCNVGRKHAGKNYYHELEILSDLSGGLPATLPHEADFFDEKIGPLLQKYIKRKEDVSSEDVYKLFRALSDMLCSSIGGVMAVAGLHGGGSPQMEDVAILKGYDLEKRKDIAKYLAGISEG